MAYEPSRPLTSAITQVVSDVAYLLQTEIQLAQAEIGEKLSRAANGGKFLGIAAVLLLSGLFVLLLAAVRWLEIAGIPTEWGLLIVGGSVAAMGVALALLGTSKLKSSTLMPNRTIEQVRADFVVAKEHVG
jgi:hypothetical protein